MRKNYFRTFMLTVMTFVTLSSLMAQQAWKTHKAEISSENGRQFETKAIPNGTLYLGHCNYNDNIYAWDGLSLDQDARVGVGIKLTRDMFEDYIGGSIEAIRVGWDDENSKASYECFIRSGNFNNENLAQGKGTVKFGWNEIRLTKAFEIPDIDTICVGFYTDLKKGVCSIPKFYPYGKPNSNFLFHGETTEDGKEIWYDSRNLGIMPIMIKIVDKEGKFSNMIEITDMMHDKVILSDMDAIGKVTITNKGSNNINSLEITSINGEETKSTEVRLSTAIEISSSKSVKLPIYCFKSGNTTVSITKVNGEAPKNAIETTTQFIGVPEEVAEKYVFRPVLEFFGSENSYHIPTYFDEYLMPGYEDFKEYMTLICHHTDDKFMIGDPDEAILLQLGMAGGDSSKIYIPDMALNRTAYISAPVNVPGTPFHYGVIYPDFVSSYYTDILQHPTFASVEVEAGLNEAGDKVNIHVSGNVEEGIMPEGEPLYLTVYLMEYGVETRDQQFWDDKEGVQLGNKYIHYNLIRENLTPLFGKQLEKTGGEYSMDFTTDVYEDYNPTKLSVIAFLNRGGENPHTQLQIINSTEAAVGTADGIHGIETANGTQGENAWYDLSGRRVIKPAKGIYVKNGQKIYIK